MIKELFNLDKNAPEWSKERYYELIKSDVI